jgi:hypothetical protein
MKNTIIKLLFIPIVVLTLLSTNCKKANHVEDTNATIELSVMSRGAYQYLIKINTDTYLSENLPQEFQKDKLEVLIDYKVLDKKAIVYKPGATDIPKEDYQVNLIDIIKIEKR